MNNNFQDEKKGRGFLTEAYHLEKYVVPGAFAVAVIFLLPWYLLGGGPLETWDFGTAVIAALVAGHMIEGLKVYEWRPAVSSNFENFKARVDGLLSGWGIQKPVSEKRDKTLTILFTVLPPTQHSEFSWNLVRWQKMTVMAAILLLGAVEWFIFAVLNYIEPRGYNPFKADFALVLFKPGFSEWWSRGSEVLIGIALAVFGLLVYRSAIGRQKRNNESYFQLILRHRRDILKALSESDAGVSQTS